MFLRPLTLALAGFCLISTAARAEPQHLGDFQSWSSYVSHDGGQDVCYISAKPSKSEGDYKKRGGVFAEVTHRPAEHHTGVFTLLGGYSFKPNAPATLDINGKSFTLFTKGDAAFAQDADDPKIVAAMRGADTMVFKGTSSHGTNTTDTFSLKGMGDAYAAIGKSCKVDTPAVPPAVKKSTTTKKS